MESFKHGVKLWWMVLWRLVVLDLFTGAVPGWVGFALPLVVAIVLTACGWTVITWPLVRSLRYRASPFYEIAVGPYFSRQPRPRYAPSSRPGYRGPAPQQTQQGGAYQAAASHNGRMTGFEPRSLESVTVPHVATMIGDPGAGLYDSNFSSRNVSLGVEGEVNFAKALAKTGLLNNFHSLWSVSVPDPQVLTPNRYNTDIDCILVAGNEVVLVDLKNYKSGDVTYSASGDQLYCTDNANGIAVGRPKKLTRNMEMALTSVQGHFPKLKVSAFVVFMPTNKGEATIAPGTTWPGGVPAIALTDFLTHLQSRSAAGSPNGAATTFIRNMGALVRS